jgi:CHAT domain-containing protein
VVTQERVDPGAAAKLAATFFRSWLGGATKAEALQAAQLELKKDGAEVKNWAAYCLIGDFA